MWRLPAHANDFVVGANLPWIGYGTDFGASAWHPDGGLSAQPAALERLEHTFAALAADGIPIVRLFVLCDGRSGIRYDPSGLPIGIDDVLFADFDALLDAARRHRISIMPTLLDFHLCHPPSIVNGVQSGGRAQLIADPDSRSALFENVLTPILERYANDDAVGAWDVFNEPEWCLKRLRPSWWGSDPFNTLQEFLYLLVQCVRRTATQPITVGSAGLWQLDLVTPLGLDFYQVHWYEKFGWRALERPVADLGLDRPVILGEFSGRAAIWPVADVLDAAERAGYRGAMVWSVLAEDDQSAYTPDVVAWMQRGRSDRIG
jgi:hypothetical protein